MKRFDDPVASVLVPLLAQVLRSRAAKLFVALWVLVLGLIALAKLGLV